MLDRLIDLIIASLRLFQFFDVVDSWERGVVLRFGRFHRQVEPGFLFMWPMAVERLLTIPVVPDPEKLDPQTLTTEDGKAVSVRAVVTFKVTDARRALLEVTSVKASLEDACSGEIGRLVSETEFANLTAGRFWNRLTKACQARAGEWGIEIMRVQLSDISITRSLSLAVSRQASIL